MCGKLGAKGLLRFNNEMEDAVESQERKDGSPQNQSAILLGYMAVGGHRPLVLGHRMGLYWPMTQGSARLPTHSCNSILFLTRTMLGF